MNKEVVDTIWEDIYNFLKLNYLEYPFNILKLGENYISYIIESDEIYVSYTESEELKHYLNFNSFNIKNRFDKFTKDEFIMSVFNILLSYHNIEINNINIYNIYYLYIMNMNLFLFPFDMMTLELKMDKNLKMISGDYFSQIKRITDEGIQIEKKEGF